MGVLFLLLYRNALRAKRRVDEQMLFVSNVTHELRTPLGVILNAGSNISDGFVEDKDSLKRYGGLITTESRRLSRMVESILLYSGLLSGRDKRERVNVDELLPPLLKPVTFQCELLGIHFEMDIQENLSLQADPEGLTSALNNLLYNGIIHGGSGGYLRLEIFHRPESGTIHFLIRDRGPGIPDSEKKHVFTPFFRGRDAENGRRPGSGIGLGLVLRVAESHGGRVSLITEKGAGTTFVLILPGGAQ